MIKLKASSLNYTILLFVLLASLVSTIIFYNYYYKLRQLNRLQKLESINNCQSGLNYLLATKSQLEFSKFDSIIRIDKEQDSIRVQALPWGGLSILYSSVKKKNLSIERVAMTANYRISDTSATLILKNNQRSLCLCLNTNIDGKVLIPGVKVNYELMNGKGFSGSYIDKELINKSNDSLPALNKYFAKLSINSLIESILSRQEEENISYKWTYKDSLTRSFKEEPLIVNAKVNSLNKIVANGNIVFVADSLIVIPKNCQLNDVIVIGKEIIIENGFEGTLQCFAKNDITVEEGVVLNYPSGLFLLPENNPISKNTKGIKMINIKEGASVSGFVFSNYLYDVSNDYELLMNIENKSIVKGLVYWPGSIQLKGKVSGQLFVDSFHIKNAFGYYNNYIADGTISKDSNVYKSVYPCFFSNQNIGEIVKWLN